MVWGDKGVAVGGGSFCVFGLRNVMVAVRAVVECHMGENSSAIINNPMFLFESNILLLGVDIDRFFFVLNNDYFFFFCKVRANKKSFFIYFFTF